MTFEVKPYRWDIRSTNPIPGVKISTEDGGHLQFLFIPDTDLYDVATKLADHIDSLAAQEDAA